MQNIEEKIKFEIAHCAETATINKKKTSQCAPGTTSITSIRNGNEPYQKTHDSSQKFVKSRYVLNIFHLGTLVFYTVGIQVIFENMNLAFYAVWVARTEMKISSILLNIPPIYLHLIFATA